MAQQPRNPPSAPPQQTFSPTFTSPMANSPSPTGDSFPPPPKRQRLSPNPPSPFQSPSVSTMSLPNAGSPVNGNTANGVHTPASAAPQGAGLMGPPSRLPEKRDKSDFTDVMTGTGIDTEEEESFLTAQYTSQGSSFGTLSAGNSFADQNQSKQPGLQSTFYGAGPFNQPPLPAKSKEELEKDQQELRDFALAKRKSYALQNSFLAADAIDRKLSARTAENGISYGKNSIMRPERGRPLPLPPTEVVGPDGTSTVVTRGETILQLDNSSLSEIMSLISLACEDRLRGFIDQSARLAQERKEHSTGVVPLEWQDVALVDDGVNRTSTGALTATNATHTNGDESSLLNNIVNPNKIGEMFQTVSQRERAAEEARLGKRAQRSKSASDARRSGSVSAPGGPGTPATTQGDSLPDNTDKKPTKKEQKKQAEAKASEAQMHKHANETARLAMGSGTMFGKKKKTYSWLNSGSKAAPTPIPTPAKINNALNESATETSGPVRPGTAGTTTTVASSGKGFGEWKEEGEKARGIQKRDLLLALEADGKAPKALHKAYAKPEDKD